MCENCIKELAKTNPEFIRVLDTLRTDVEALANKAQALLGSMVLRIAEKPGEGDNPEVGSIYIEGMEAEQVAIAKQAQMYVNLICAVYYQVENIPDVGAFRELFSNAA